MDTYNIIRFHRDESHPWHHMVVRESLTLEEAQAWCQRPDTSERDEQGVVWFDGYERES